MELKPCPWCGSDKIVFGGSPGHMYLSCIGCNAEGPYGDFSEAEAIAAWNRRTPSRDEVRYRWLRLRLAGAEHVAELVEFNTGMHPELPGNVDAAIAAAERGATRSA